MRVFVLLEHGKGDPAWGERFARGQVYEETPYGYGLAAGSGAVVTFSHDHTEGRVGSFLRRGVSKVLGFDLVHAVRQLPLLRTMDVVWTHTEREHLALGLLRGFGVQLPPVIAQSVWVADRWDTWSPPRRALYRWCLRHVDALTTLSPENAAVLRHITNRPVEVVAFGVRADPWSGSGDEVASTATPIDPGAGAPLRILCLGNDVHRDWEVLRGLARVAGPGAEVTLVTRRLDATFATGVPNLHVRPADRVSQTADAYAAADVVCLPLKPNLHASGITVLLEAATWSLPCIVTDTGGLRSYFDEDAVRYLAPDASPELWWAAVRDLLAGAGAGAGAGTVARMRGQVTRAELTDTGYAARHVTMSTTLITQRANSQYATARSA